MYLLRATAHWCEHLFNVQFLIWHQILDIYRQQLVNTAFSKRPENTILSEDHDKTHKNSPVLFCKHKCFAILLFLLSCVV